MTNKSSLTKRLYIRLQQSSFLFSELFSEAASRSDNLIMLVVVCIMLSAIFQLLSGKILRDVHNI